MKNQFSVTAEYCADFLGSKLIGKDFIVKQFSALYDNSICSIRFANIFNQQNLVLLNSYQSSLAIVSIDYSNRLFVPHILSKNPRLDFIRLMDHLLNKTQVSKIEQSAIIGTNVDLGADVYIGCNVVIESNVSIGEGTSIMHNVVIASGTKIGRHCLVKSGTVIGQKGFGFERDEDGIPLPFLHLGGVSIGDFVELGAFCTVVAGALSPTIIEDYVKTDDHVHIAHNVTIGKNTLVAAAAEISGSVKIGTGAWLGPNCSLIDKISVGDNSFVGIGAVVTKSVAPGDIVAGNPARSVKKSSTPRM